MLQDRNLHRDAKALRKSIAIPTTVPAFGVDQDEPIFACQPRYNWRLSDLEVQHSALATADLIVKAQAVPPGAAVGSPQLGAFAALTFQVEEFWKKRDDNNAFSNVGAQFQGFSNAPLRVLDGFWGVFLLIVDSSDALEVIVNDPVQAYETEEIALANCPKVRPTQFSSGTVGRAAIGTILAGGAFGDWVAGSSDTNELVALNTAPQDGHVVTESISTSPRSFQSERGQQLKDASETNILQGKGGTDTPVVGEGGDSLVLSVRSAGAPVLTGGIAVVEYRPWPAGGEGVGDASVSQNRPSFVP